MKIDNSEFIKKHHKPSPLEGHQGRKKRNLDIVYPLLILLVFCGVLLSVVLNQELDSATRFLAAFSCAFACGTIFLAFYFYRTHLNREQEFDVIRRVLEGSRGARFITDSADEMIYCNSRFKNVCEGVGTPGLKTLMRLFENNEEAGAHFRLLADQAHRGLTDTIELFSSFEDRERWFMITAQPVMDYEGYIHWRIDDVTDKYNIDRAIREEREKLIDFTDNAPVGFFSVDEKGRFVFANATFARWVGEDLRSLLYKGTLHTYLVAPPKNARPFDVIEDARPRQVVELKMKGAAGSTFLASINQTVVQEADGRVRTRAVVHDLTTEREMHRALQASEDRFQRFFEEAPLGIVLLDKRGVIANCNHVFAEFLGVDIPEAEGQKFSHVIDPQSRDSVMGAIDQIESGQQMDAPMEVSLKGKEEGKGIQVQMHARRFRESEEIVLHFIDLSEKKALEEQFAQSQKMQAIGQLAGGVAHDFNNLLTAMIGFCDLLLLRHKPGDPSFADIMQIKQNSNRAAQLVGKLLAFSRQQTLRPRIHDPVDILIEVSHLLRRLIGSGIELNLLHGDDLGMIKVDQSQMEQVMMNLAVNARDAMQGKGTLTIESSSFSNKETQKVTSDEILPVGHWVVISVTDTGSGIPKEILSRILEPFFTTKDVGEGTGLGLATVYGIIRQTGGYLDIDSQEGEGTTFRIYLPRASEAEEEDVKDEAVEDETKDLTGTECLLLVEDEDAVRMFSQRALSNKGYEVLVANGGDAALEIIDGLGEKKLDMLITDVVMPGMDGPTLAQRVRQNNKDLKIIFMSGYTEDKLKDHMGKNIWFLPKPFTLKKLAAKVKEALED